MKRFILHLQDHLRLWWVQQHHEQSMRLDPIKLATSYLYFPTCMRVGEGGGHRCTHVTVGRLTGDARDEGGLPLPPLIERGPKFMQGMNFTPFVLQNESSEKRAA